MGAWDVVEKEDDMNVIDSNWGFKCKQFLNGTVKKFESLFLVGNDPSHPLEEFRGYFLT